jgi:asparagine synthase (glutamine-hydrolysing)
MCGITGIVSVNIRDQHLPRLIRTMNDTLQHRGPDDEGFMLAGNENIRSAGGKDTQPSAWNAPFDYCPTAHIEEAGNDFHLAFGHRRLSVIDLSEAAHQPMCIHQKKIWITCNGEIYNYIELRNELLQKGIAFQTQSDIEVLLKAYEYWGISCLEKFNGMWSFVIYDAEKNILFGSRDRFGVKPMYYYFDENFFAFASEQKALLTLPAIQTGINHTAVFEHLLMAQVELRYEGFFKNIYELEPAHYFIYDIRSHQVDINNYFSPDFENKSIPLNQKNNDVLSRKLREHMFRAVDMRLRSDVPVGFCLSGGLDSSSIVSMACKLSQEKKLSQLTDRITVFTATNGFDECDESKWAKMVAEKNNVRWIKAECNAQNIPGELENIIYHQDIPLYSTSTYAQNKVMQAAKENGITILLDGQGGDELFAGYPVHFTSYYLELFRRFRWGRFFSELHHTGNSPTSKTVFFKSLFKIGLDAMTPGFMVPSIARSVKKELEFFGKDFSKENYKSIHFSNDFDAKPLNACLNKYCTDYYLKNLLRWEDRCSMQYSIESRTPFSDDVDLINFIFSVPSSYKIKNGWSKYLMREAMKGIIPEEIRLRKDKLGFATPQQNWLMQINQSLKTYVSDLGNQDEIIDHQLILDKWNVIFKEGGNSKIQDFVWRYVCFLIWKKIFF